MTIPFPRLLLPLLFLFAGFSGLSAQNWRVHTPNDCPCEFSLPGLPKIRMTDQGDVRGVRFTTHVGVITFHVIFTRFKEDFATTYPDSIYGTDGLEKLMGMTKSESVVEKKWKVKKYKGKRWIITDEKMGATIEYRAVAVGNMGYKLSWVAPSEGQDKKIRKKFFKSFKLRPQE